METQCTAFDNRTSASTISAATTKPVRRDRPARRGKRWNKAEEMDMIALLMNGNSPQDIAAWLQRTPLAIIMRSFTAVPKFLNDSIATRDAKNKELTEQLESMSVMVGYLLREKMAKSVPTIGNSA